MAACFSCVGSGAATPATSTPPGVCPRCAGTGVEPEPGAVGVFRVDVVSVADPDRPFFVACFEADSRQEAAAIAGLVVAERATNPDLHYGDLYEYTPAADRPGRLAYLYSIEPPPAAGDRVQRSALTVAVSEVAAAAGHPAAAHTIAGRLHLAGGNGDVSGGVW
jgi:hypothetical protein